MKKVNPQIVPFGVMAIAAFYLFGAVILLISMFTNPLNVGRSIADAHGLPPAFDIVILPLVAALALLMAYGLFQLSRWGYLLAMTYLVLFGGINIWLMIQNWQQPYIGNSTWAVLAFVYLFWKRKLFR